MAAGALSLAYSVLFNMQVAAFAGLGLTFWGAIFALAKNGKYVESSLLDSSARSTYSTIDRVVNDLKYKGQGFYIPAYPRDVIIPEYLKNLKEPVVYISESFDGTPSVDELAAGKFLSAKSNGIFLTAPGAGIMAQIEKQLRIDLSKISVEELSEVLPKSLTETFNLARTAEMHVLPDGVRFKAMGVVYESLYKPDYKSKGMSIMGCPVVSAVASALAKASGKTVTIKEQAVLPSSCGVQAVFAFM